MVAHDRIRLIGPVSEMRTPALLRGCSLEWSGESDFGGFRTRRREARANFQQKIMRTPKSLSPRNGSYYFAHATGACQLFPHLRFVLALIGDEIRVIHFGETSYARLVLLLCNRLIGREAVHVVAPREE